MTAFLESRYIVAMVGSTNGIVECDSFDHLKHTLHDMFPNPGDATLANVLNPMHWTPAGEDDMPYFIEALVPDGERDDFRLSIYRVMELEN